MTLYATPFITAEHMTYSTSIKEDLFKYLTGMSMQAYADDQQQKLESGEYEYQTFTATPEPKQTTILVKKMITEFSFSDINNQNSIPFLAINAPYACKIDTFDAVDASNGIFKIKIIKK